MKSSALNSNKSYYGFRDIPFMPMDKQEQARVVGGDYYDDLFNLLFDTSMLPTNGTDPASINNFLIIEGYKNAFRELASTMVGYQLFEQMKLSSGKIVLDPTPITLPAQGLYNSANNHLQVDPLIPFFDGDFFITFAHEIYHAFSDIVESHVNDFHDIKGEVNANIFSTMAAIQYDKDRHISPFDINSKSYYLETFEVTPPIDPQNYDISAQVARTLFKQAWDDIILRGLFTTTNYNTLVDLFVSTEAGQGYLPDMGYGGTSPSGGILTANPVTDLSASQSIDELFESYFKEFYTTWNGPNGGYGDYGGGGNGGGNGSFENFAQFMQEIWNLQNQGWVFYTSSTTTYTPGLSDMGIYAWENGSWSTTYTYAGMGNFFNYYINGGNGSGWGFGSGGGGFFPSGSY